jgi:plasmid stability protein
MISLEKESRVAQLVVRRIEAEVKERLHRIAKRHGRSMEEEVRDILRSAARQDEALAGGLGTEIASLFTKSSLKNDIAELHGHTIKPASFE